MSVTEFGAICPYLMEFLLWFMGTENAKFYLWEGRATRNMQLQKFISCQFLLSGEIRLTQKQLTIDYRESSNFLTFWIEVLPLIFKGDLLLSK